MKSFETIKKYVAETITGKKEDKNISEAEKYITERINIDELSKLID